MLRRNLVMSGVGALLGVLLAVTAPPGTLVANQPCQCHEGAPGQYKCNEQDDGCDAGATNCVICCGSEEICNPDGV